MGEAQPSVVNITVRCAFQTGQDIRVESPLTWTIKNLKEHLHDACSLHPAVTSQRLIYAGACLTDDMTISSIVARRTFEGEPVFHLVCPLPQSSPELRRRENRPQAAPTTGNTNPQAFNNPWQGAFFGVPAGSAAPMQSGNQAQAYQAYYAWYMNNYAHMMSYYQNMAMATGSAAAAATGNPVGAAGFGFPIFPQNGMNGFAPQAQINDQLQQQQPGGNVQQVQEDADAGIRMAGVGGGGDILDIAYSLFRIALFLSVVLLYASFERFLIVFAIGLFIFFIQLRRGQRRAADAANPPPVPVNNNNNGENGGGGGNAPQPQDIGMEQTGIQIFFSTCYSFITSFFTSLVPENPVPVNLN